MLWQKRADDDLLPTWDQADWFSKEARIAEIFGSFLKRRFSEATG